MPDSPKLNPAKTIDCLGMRCPLPLLHLRRALISLDSNQLVSLLANDPNSCKDVAFFCQSYGHELVQLQELADSDNAIFWCFYIKKH